jgi:hypothetical protein
MKKLLQIIVTVFATIGVLYVSFLAFVLITVKEQCDENILSLTASPDSKYTILTKHLNCRSDNRETVNTNDIHLILRENTKGKDEIVTIVKLGNYEEAFKNKIKVIWKKNQELKVQYDHAFSLAVARTNVLGVHILYEKLNMYSDTDGLSTKNDILTLLNKRYPAILEGKKVYGPYKTVLQSELDGFASQGDNLLVVHVLNSDKKMSAVIFIEPDTKETYLTRP